jgi:hypothetical protein
MSKILYTSGDIAVVSLEMFRGATTHTLSCNLIGYGWTEYSHKKLSVSGFGNEHLDCTQRFITYKEYIKQIEELFSPVFPIKIKECHLPDPLKEHFWMWVLDQQLFEFDWENMV